MFVVFAEVRPAAGALCELDTARETHFEILHFNYLT